MIKVFNVDSQLLPVSVVSFAKPLGLGLRAARVGKYEEPCEHSRIPSQEVNARRARRGAKKTGLRALSRYRCHSSQQPKPIYEPTVQQYGCWQMEAKARITSVSALSFLAPIPEPNKPSQGPPEQEHSSTC